MTSKYARPNYSSFPSKLHKKIHRNNNLISFMKMRSKKVHRNDVGILLIEVTSKNTLKWRGNWSISSFRCIDIMLISNRLSVWVEKNIILKLVIWTQTNLTNLIMSSLTHQSEPNWLAMWVEKNDSHKLVT